MDIDSLKNKIENIFIELGFKKELVGEKQNQYLVHGNCYCKITYLEKLRAFVIESADAINGALEDGDLYYMDISEDAMLYQLRRDVVAYYMD